MFQISKFKMYLYGLFIMLEIPKINIHKFRIPKFKKHNG